MNDEIDLRPAFTALMRNWKIIIAAVLIFGLIAGLIKILTTPPYEARATLLITNKSIQVEPSTPIVSNQAPLNVIGNTQSDIIEDLIKNDVIMDRLEDLLKEKGLNVKSAQLKNQLLDIHRENSTTFILKAYGHTSSDAAQLVELYAREAIRFIYESYGPDDALLVDAEQQLRQAQERYQKAQNALVQFIERGEIEATSQEIQRISNVVEGARAAILNRYKEYLNRMNQIDQMLRDARLLRERLKGGEVDLSDSLSALLFRMQSINAEGGPILQLDASVVNNISVSVTEIDGLINSLESEYSRLQRDVEMLSVTRFDNFTKVNLEQLYDQLFTEQARLEQLNRQQAELVRERDAAYSLYDTLLRRIDELKLEELSRPTTVRYLGTVIDEEPSIVPKAALFAALGGLIGLAASVFLIIARTLFNNIANQTPIPEVRAASD